MTYKEITMYDIIHNPQKVQNIITDNANHFNNDLYILKDGNHFEFDATIRDALNCLMLRIQDCLRGE